MTCDDCDRLLGDYVDGALPAAATVAVERHLAACPPCQAAAADCRAIRALARELEPHVPPPRVWQALAEATSRPPLGRSMHAFSVAWRPAAAAAMVLTVSIALCWVGARLSFVTGPIRAAADVASRGTGGEEVHATSDGPYASTIARLEALTGARRAALDPELAAVLDAGLTVVDSAIDQSRAALATAPESAVARESLFQALRTKVELLQDTLALVSDVRSGAARIAEITP